mgnify:CR=1 FL=1
MAQQHAVSIILQAKNSFQFSAPKPVHSKTTPKTFALAKDEIQNRIAQFDVVTDAAISSQGLSEDEKVKKFQANAKRAILYSSLSDEFATKYLDEIYHEKSYASLMKFITETIGTQTERQKIAEAEDKLNSITRNIQDGERFGRFLERCTRLADDITTNPSIKSYLIQNAFSKNLSPKIRAFLREHDQTDKTPSEKAAYLDKMHKFVPEASVNALETNDAGQKINDLVKQNDELHQQNESLHKKFDLLQTEMRVMMSSNTSNTAKNIDINEIVLELNKLSAKQNNFQKSNGIQRNQQNSGTLVPPPQHASYPAHWDLNKYGAPYRCRKCGVRGHKDENCKGSVRCHGCQQQGHIQAICPNNRQQAPKQPTQKNY